MIASFDISTIIQLAMNPTMLAMSEPSIFSQKFGAVNTTNANNNSTIIGAIDGKSKLGFFVKVFKPSDRDSVDFDILTSYEYLAYKPKVIIYNSFEYFNANDGLLILIIL